MWRNVGWGWGVNLTGINDKIYLAACLIIKCSVLFSVWKNTSANEPTLFFIRFLKEFWCNSRSWSRVPGYSCLEYLRRKMHSPEKWLIWCLIFWIKLFEPVCLLDSHADMFAILTGSIKTSSMFHLNHKYFNFDDMTIYACEWWKCIMNSLTAAWNSCVYWGEHEDSHVNWPTIAQF